MYDGSQRCSSIPPATPPEHPYTRVIRPPAVTDARHSPPASPPQPYGLGSQRLQPLLSAQESRGMVTNELGLLLGDPIGRSSCSSSPEPGVHAEASTSARHRRPAGARLS